MKINRNNYEAYFIDYLDGNLDEKLVDDFLEFLQQNPDLKDELTLFQSVSLEPENIQFSKKEKLYKNKFDLEDNFNQASVASLEGDFNNDEKTEFENYLKSHPEKRKDFQLFKKTKLQPNLSIHFDKKRNLYRQSKSKTIVMWGIRIAAVLILAFTFYVLADRYSNNKITETNVAVNQNETPQKQNPEKVTSVETKKQTESTEDQGQKTEKKPDVKTIEPNVNKPIQKLDNSMRENNNGRTDEKDVLIVRTPVEALETVPRLSASLDTKQPKATLGNIHFVIPEEQVNKDDERLLADVVKEKAGINKLSFGKIAKAGLNLVVSISKDKLTYETNESGNVTEIKYDSRLLAFSIPTKKEADK